MSRPTISPVTTTVPGHYAGHTVERTTHPAFGRVELSHRHGKTYLCGSELLHHETMHITVFKAESCRDLSNDRIVGQEIVCAFEFSLAQWAQFIASQGIGSGTPATLDMHRTGALEVAPAIGAPPESHLGRFTREMHESLNERTEGIRNAVAAALAAVDAGAGKKQVREALATAARHAQQLPGSVEFVNTQFAESMEHIVGDAKTELEGFVSNMAIRTGIKALANAAPSLAQLGEASPPTSSPFSPAGTGSAGI